MSEIRVNIFQDGTVFFPSIVCEKNFSLTLRSFNGIYLFSQLPAYCLWTCLGYTILLLTLRPSLNAEGQTRVTTRHAHGSSVPPQTLRNTCHLRYSSRQSLPGVIHDYLKKSQRGRSNCPGLHGWWAGLPGWKASSLHWPGTSFTKGSSSDFECNHSLDFIGLIRINIRWNTG